MFLICMMSWHATKVFRPERIYSLPKSYSPMRVVDSTTTTTMTTIRSDGLQRFACPNERCRFQGGRGKGNIRVNGWSGTRKRFRQLICHECGKTFSENYGTP